MSKHNLTSIPRVPQDDGAPASLDEFVFGDEPAGAPQAAIKVVVAPEVKRRLRIAAAKRDLTVSKLLREVFVEWLDANNE